MTGILTNDEDLSSLIRKEITLENAPHELAVDSRHGPVTTECIMQLQSNVGLNVTGTVEEAPYEVLMTPLINVLQPVSSGGNNLAKPTIFYSQQRFVEHRIEVGGDNRGSRVRLETETLKDVSINGCYAVHKGAR